MEAGLEKLKDRNGNPVNYSPPSYSTKYESPYEGTTTTITQKSPYPSDKLNAIKKQNKGIEVDFNNLKSLENKINKDILYSKPEGDW